MAQGLLQDLSQTAAAWLQDGSEAPLPGKVVGRPGRLQIRGGWANISPGWSCIGPGWLQDGFKVAPRWLRDGSRARPKMAPRMLHNQSRQNRRGACCKATGEPRTKIVPGRLEGSQVVRDGSRKARWAEGRRKTIQREPNMLLGPELSPRWPSFGPPRWVHDGFKKGSR